MQSIEEWPVPDELRVPREARAGQSVGLTLDRQIFVNRGDLISARQTSSKSVSRLRARIFWLHDKPLAAGATLTVRVAMSECRGTVALIENVVDPGQLSASEAATIAQNHVGEIEIALAQPIAADLYAVNPRTGRLVLDLGGRIAGGGLVLSTDSQDGSTTARATPAAASGARSRASGLAEQASYLSKVLGGLSVAERLSHFRSEVDGKIIFTTSFGVEDQVILHVLAEHAIDVDIVTLDTGRLFPETYELWAETERRYQRRIRAIYPKHEDLEALVEKFGINGFYEFARGALRLLSRPQGGAAQPRARWRGGLDRRASRRPVRASAGNRPRHSRRAQSLETQPVVRLDAGQRSVICDRQSRPDQPTAREGFPVDWLRSMHPGGCAR